jgi:protein disulfide-isomerase A6
MARLVSLLCATAAATASATLELTPENFDKEVFQSGKSALVKFLAPW